MKTFRLPHSMLAVLLLIATVTATSCSHGGGVIPEPEYAITATNDGNGTAAASHGKAEAGTEVTLTATPDTGYIFSKWTVVSGGITLADETANPATFTMPANAVSVKAEFTIIPPNTYAITVTNDGNGTAQADAGTAEAGTTIKLSATPNTGYKFSKWTVVSGGITLADETANPATFIMPANAVSVRAEFKTIDTNDVLTFITDPNFLAYAEYCMDNANNGWDAVGQNKTYPAWDLDGNGILSFTEAAKVEFIGLRNGYPDDGNHRVKSLDGIEYFTGVKVLVCDENELTELDLTTNTALERLQCGLNKYSELEVSHLTALVYLYCGNSEIETLDVSQNTALAYLNCQNSNLKTLDVSNNTLLHTLYCPANEISTLTIGNNTTLTTLYCQSNKLETIDIANCTALRDTNFQDNLLTELNVSNCPNLTAIYADRNLLTTFDITSNTKLRFVRCELNRLSTFDASKMEIDSYDGNYYVTCGMQKTADGTADQTLALTLRDAQKPYWESDLKDSIENDNVVIQ